jgi:hypothetical protein
MNQDIKNVIHLVDSRIDELQKLRAQLLELYGGSNLGANAIEKKILPLSKKNEGTRREALIKLLKDSGPMTRAEIWRITNFPIGTIAANLNDKKTFKNENGKWILVQSE